MMADCVQDKTDVIVLISADTDLIPPLNFIHTNYPNKKVKVFFPPGSHAHDLRNHLNAFRSKWVFLENNERRFRNAVMLMTCVTISTLSVVSGCSLKITNAAFAMQSCLQP